MEGRSISRRHVFVSAYVRSGDLKLSDGHVVQLTDTLDGFRKYISTKVMHVLEQCNEPFDFPANLSRVEVQTKNKRGELLPVTGE